MIYFKTNIMWYLQLHLVQLTRNYTQTTKRGFWQQIKIEYQAPRKCEIFSLFCCPRVPNEVPLWHTALLAKYSVLYALSALPWKCCCRRGEQEHLKQQGNRTVIAWRGATSAGLVSSADRAYRKTLASRRTMGHKVSRIDSPTHKSKWIFLSKLK